MASKALVQIDENASLVHSNDAEHVLLPPLLTPSSNAAGEKTPESCRRRLSRRPSLTIGDSTPEVWPPTPTPKFFPRASLALELEALPPTPKALPPTPTPRRQRSFALGDQTPECWPEVPASFFPTSQHQGIAQQQTAPMTAGPSSCQMLTMMPVWSQQTAHPLGGAPGSTGPQSVNAQLFGAVGNSRSSTAVQKPQAVAEVASDVKASLFGKKPPRASRQDEGADDACPVAIYVDLSGLKEMKPFGRPSRSML